MNNPWVFNFRSYHWTHHLGPFSNLKALCISMVIPGWGKKIDVIASTNVLVKKLVCEIGCGRSVQLTDGSNIINASQAETTKEEVDDIMQKSKVSCIEGKWRQRWCTEFTSNPNSNKIHRQRSSLSKGMFGIEIGFEKREELLEPKQLELEHERCCWREIECIGEGCFGRSSELAEWWQWWMQNERCMGQRLLFWMGMMGWTDNSQGCDLERTRVSAAVDPVQKWFLNYKGQRYSDVKREVKRCTSSCDTIGEIEIARAATFLNSGRDESTGLMWSLCPASGWHEVQVKSHNWCEV